MGVIMQKRIFQIRWWGFVSAAREEDVRKFPASRRKGLGGAIP